jgi:hypothetical protein
MFSKLWAFVCAATLFAICPLHAAADGGAKPVFLYSRYYNAQGDNRYLRDGAFREALDLLTNEFEVKTSSAPLTRESLAGVKVVLIATPSDQPVGNGPRPPHMNRQDANAISSWVSKGGALIMMQNQENHNLEVRDMNLLLGRFGIEATNVYTDAKLLRIPSSNSVLGGLRWAYYTGNGLQLKPANPGRPKPLIPNDLSQKPAKGTRDTEGALVASATPGKGRVIVATDSGWICDWAFNGQGVGGVGFKEHDNQEIWLRMVRWAAGKK